MREDGGEVLAPGAALLRPRGETLRVVQVTDTHLEHAPGGSLLGMDTDHSLRHVLALVGSHGLQPDLVLATGDLANHGTEAAYLRCREAFDALGVPWYWLPGNHDDAGPMGRVLGRGAPRVREVRAPHWQVLLLDSTVPGEVGGRLGEEELAWLAGRLAAGAEPNVLVCLHHQPVPIGCAWLDEQRLEDGRQFLDLLDRHPRVRAVIWGHVHQEFARERNGVRLLAAPSTCIQFAPHSEGFRVDERAPGLRWLELGADGSVATGVLRVEGVEFAFDRDSAGYL